MPLMERMGHPGGPLPDVGMVRRTPPMGIS